MSNQASITFVDKGIGRFFNNLNKKYKPEVEKTLQKTAQYALITTKKTLPSRTGLLRKSYLAEKLDRMTYLISQSKLQYADSVEEGSKPRVILPKRGKFLTIPIKKSALTSTGARIKTSKLQELFDKLNNRGGKSARQIYEEVGIVLAKKVNHPGSKAGNYFKNKIRPKTQKFLNREMDKTFRRLGFND